LVGVESFKKVTDEELEWLKNGGRNKIEQMARKFMKIWQKAGKHGDFYLTIDLPTDILVCAKRKESKVTHIWRFDHYRRESAVELFKALKKEAKEGDEVRITTMREEWDCGDNEVRVDVTWHGTEAYCTGWEYCFSVVPEKLFPHGI